MKPQIEKSSQARIFAILVLFAIIPIWYFYIGKEYSKTRDILEGKHTELQSYLGSNG